MNLAGPQQPQVDSQDLQKLEEDLKNLETEASNTQQSATSIPPVVPVPPEVPELTVNPTVPPTETPILAQQSTSSTGSPKKNSLMLVAIVLMVLAILAAIAYAIGMQFLGQKTTQNNVSTATAIPSPTVIPTSTPDPTADWSVYSNTKYGYSFKYSPDWVLTSAPIGKNDNKDLNTSSYLILQNQNNEFMYFTSSTLATTPAVQRGYSETEKTVNLIFAKNSFPNGEGPNSTPFVRYEISNTNNTFVIEARGSSPISMTQNQILSTFKFVNATSLVSPSPTSSTSAMPAGY